MHELPVTASQATRRNSASPNAACRPDCARPRCGDGVRDTGEACDEGTQNSDARPNGCRTNCQAPRCGDGVVGATEVCDDSNFDVGDGCAANCTSDETCGNAVVDAGKGEQCDDRNGVGLSGDGCTSRCALEFPAMAYLAYRTSPPFPAEARFHGDPTARASSRADLCISRRRVGLARTKGPVWRSLSLDQCSRAE